MGGKRKHSADAASISDAFKDEHLAPSAALQDAFATRERHFANLYTIPPDFKHLASKDPQFAAIVKGRELDFNDPKAVMQLTRTLLKLDFDLNIQLLDDRLCPPVTNRHNYIIWLKGLLDTSSYDMPGGKLVGLDIGTGASCIYPILGCAQRPWSFIGTDIDEKSFGCAKKNVELNNFQSRIKLVLRQPEDALIPLDELGIDSIAFTMTNPPFYKSQDELLSSAATKSRPPFTACTGSANEMVTEGGEIGFVNRILAESLVLKERVQWYTAMFGFLSSLVDFIAKLKQHKIGNYAVTEFVQGNKTRRWAVAWSFGQMLPAQHITRGTKAAISKNILPPITELDIASSPVPDNIGEFANRIRDSIGKLDLISWEWDPEKLQGRGRAVDKVWGRAWRRRKKREQAGQEVKELNFMLSERCEIGFEVSIRVGKDGLVVGCRWREGHDPILFESFQGYLKAVVCEALDKK